MKTWSDVERLCRKIVWDRYHVDTDEYLGLMFIAYKEACETFDPLKASFNTHLRWTLLGTFSNHFNYDCSLIHIPVLVDEKVSCISYDAPVSSDSELTYADMLASPSESSEDALVAFFLDECASLYPNVASGLQKAIKALVAEIKHGDVPPRKLRTEMCNLRKILMDRYRKKYLE
jgi:hypothetical protein